MSKSANDPIEQAVTGSSSASLSTQAEHILSALTGQDAGFSLTPYLDLTVEYADQITCHKTTGNVTLNKIRILQPLTDYSLLNGVVILHYNSDTEQTEERLITSGIVPFGVIKDTAYNSKHEAIGVVIDYIDLDLYTINVGVFSLPEEGESGSIYDLFKDRLIMGDYTKMDIFIGRWNQVLESSGSVAITQPADASSATAILVTSADYQLGGFTAIGSFADLDKWYSDQDSHTGLVRFAANGRIYSSQHLDSTHPTDNLHYQFVKFEK